MRRFSLSRITVMRLVRWQQASGAWRRRCGMLLLACMAAAGLTACTTTPPGWNGHGDMPMGPMAGGRWGHGMGGQGGGMMMGGSMLRRRNAMMSGFPETYSGLRNPLPADPRVIDAGGSLYQANCAVCHGDRGAGDGPAAAGMVPPPANLRRIAQGAAPTDGYLMWAMSDGGGAFGSAMPAFKDSLSEADRWKIIRFLQTL